MSSMFLPSTNKRSFVYFWEARSGFEPWPGMLCCVLGQDTWTLSVPLSTQEYKWLPANCLGKPNKLRRNVPQWTSIPSRERRNTPSLFMLQKPGISSGSYESVSSKVSFFFFSYIHLHFSGNDWSLAGVSAAGRLAIQNVKVPRGGPPSNCFW